MRSYKQWENSLDQDSQYAKQLWEAADVLGRAAKLVDDMGRQMHPAIEAEGDAADKIVIEGQEVTRAMRTLSMRLDRAAMVKFGGGD